MTKNAIMRESVVSLIKYLPDQLKVKNGQRLIRDEGSLKASFRFI